MREYKIVKTFRGSNDGITVALFEEGTTAFVSDDLASAMDDHLKPIVEPVVVENKATITTTSRGKK